MRSEKRGALYHIPELRDRVAVFRDREDGGRALAEMLAGFRGSGAVVLALPAGGVPVGAVIAERLGLEFDLLVVSKITLPWTTEAGCGAVAFDGTVLLNEELIKDLRLSKEDVQRGIERTFEKVKRRTERTRRGRPFPSVDNRPVIVVDDGLASGFTMKTAVRTLRKMGAKDIIVAVPTASLQAAVDISREVEGLYCPNLRGGLSFAVADAYLHWYDLDDSEVERILERLRPKSEKLHPEGGKNKKNPQKDPVDHKGGH